MMSIENGEYYGLDPIGSHIWELIEPPIKVADLISTLLEKYDEVIIMMSPTVKKVFPRQDYTLHLVFDNGEEKIFNIAPYLNKGIFKKLKDLKNFYSVRASGGTVQWSGGQDLCPDTLYLDGDAVK